MDSALNDLKTEIKKGAALVVVGTGVSAGASGGDASATWLGLLKNGVDRCCNTVPNLIPGWRDRTLPHLESGDTDEMVVAAQLIASQLHAPHGGEFRKWLRETVGTLSLEDTSTIDALQGLNLPLATTNYDSLLSIRTGRPPVTWRTMAAAQRWIRNDDQSILHLHGHWENPESIVLGIRSYDEVLRDEPTQALLRACLYCRTLLFVGYGRGLHDPNFSALLNWSRAVLAQSEYWHYRLVLDADIEEVQAQHSGDRVRVIGVGDSYDRLPDFIHSLGAAPQLVSVAPSGVEANLQELVEGRADLHRRRELLMLRKEELSQLTFISQLYEIAKAMASLRGRKSAITMLHHEYSKAADSLEPALRVRVGLQLCQWLLEDAQYEFARRLLAGFYEQDVMAHLSTSDQASVLSLAAECSFCLFSEQDCIAFYREAVEVEKHHVWHEQLVAKLLEASMLFGDRAESENLHDRYESAVVSPAIRAEQAAIKARCLSRSGKTDEALALLTEIKANTKCLSEHAIDQIEMLASELLYLDGRDEEALNLAEALTAKLDGDTSAEWSAVVRRNTVTIGFSLWKPDATKRFYDLVDEQRLARISLRDTEAVLDAKEAAEAGKHYDTLPELWMEVRRTYRQGAWSIWRWALKNASLECLQVGYYVPALRFAVLAMDDKVCRSATEALISRHNQEEIGWAADWLLANSNPRRLFSTASVAIEVLADAFTGSQIRAVYEWLLPRCDFAPSTRVEEETCRRAWRAMKHIAIQIDTAESDRLCQAALKHRFWTAFDTERSSLRSAVGNCLCRCSLAVKNVVAKDLANAVGNGDSKTKEDYLETINLFAYSFSLADEETKQHLREKVYPKGAKLTPELVLIAPSIVTRDLFSSGVDEWVKKVTAELKLEVQHLGPGETPKPVSGSMMQFTLSKQDGGQHLVHIRSEVSLKAALSRRADMSDEVFDSLLAAIELGIVNPDNLLTNRIALVQLLLDATPYLTETQAVRIVRKLAPIVEGDIGTNIEEWSEEQSGHPLSRYRLKGGSKQDLRAVSLLTLAEIEKSQATGMRRRIGKLIQQSTVSELPRLRCYAFRAWAVHPQLATDARLQILLATAESDKQVLAEAFAAIKEVEQAGFSNKEWRVLVRRSRLAARSPDREIRWCVASCLNAILSHLPSGVAKREAEQLLKQLAGDPCYSVRSAAMAYATDVV